MDGAELLALYRDVRRLTLRELPDAELLWELAAIHEECDRRLRSIPPELGKLHSPWTPDELAGADDAIAAAAILARERVATAGAIAHGAATERRSGLPTLEDVRRQQFDGRDG